MTLAANCKIYLNFFQIKNLSGNNTIPEYKVQEVKHSRFILLHYGIFKIGWDWLILICTFYIAIIVPYNAAFGEEQGGGRDSIVTDVIVEMLFILGKYSLLVIKRSLKRVLICFHVEFLHRHRRIIAFLEYLPY